MGIREKIKGILRFSDPPDRLALAFAIGVFIAFTPTVGLHTISALFVASVFRVNKAVTFAGTLISNPYTQIPVWGVCLWFGSELLGQRIGFDLDWGNLSLWNLWAELKPLLLPLFLGATVLGILAAIVSYLILYYLVKRYRKYREQTSL
jgi:uncharacterized protein (DUF2062 family)